MSEPVGYEEVRETHRHHCGHEAAYATPVGLEVAPVDTSQPCWKCQPGGDDPFSDDEIAETEHEQYCDFHGLPRDPSRWQHINTDPASDVEPLTLQRHQPAQVVYGRGDAVRRGSHYERSED